MSPSFVPKVYSDPLNSAGRRAKCASDPFGSVGRTRGDHQAIHFGRASKLGRNGSTDDSRRSQHQGAHRLGKCVF